MAEIAYAPSPEEIERDRIAVAGFLLRLRRRGITDQRIVNALEAVPRRLFVPHDVRDESYVERALPIECGQTISSPEMVGLMTSALDVRPDSRVLEIGTGSGYQTAVLSHLAAHVFTIDRFRTLVEAAQLRFRTLKLSNITAIFGDGSRGWPEAKAQFDRIIVTAAAPAVPQALIDQLAPAGIMVVPVGPEEGVQTLLRINRDEHGFTESRLADVRFVPLIPGEAARL